MSWVLASDHAAVDMRRALGAWLKSQGEEVLDLGPDVNDSVDYPDKADDLCQALLTGKASYGILLCGSGIGVSIRANRYKGIRAAVVHNAQTAELAKAHNNANVLCMGARIISVDEAQTCLEAFYKTHFEGGRHARRVDKLDTEVTC